MARINETRRLRDLDPAFLQRYNLQGPRYTSYPTAPEWTEEFGADAWREHLETRRAEGAGQPLSIYVHIPFCRERCAFCGCNSIATTRGEAVADPYLDLVEREAEAYAAFVGRDRPLVQLHWGGGTPTYLNAEELRRLHSIVTSRFALAPGAEQSIEIHINWTNAEQIRTLAELGFNRLSVGVQDFNRRTQEAIGRIQSWEQTRDAVELARANGFAGINCDLIYGLPHQSAETYRESIDRMLELRPGRMALYNFAFLPGRMANQRVIDRDSLPGPEEKFRIFLAAHDAFIEAGYRYIGLDHFALPGDELALAFDAGTMQRNFMGFTTHAGADTIGLGASGIGMVAGAFAQNLKRLSQYERALDEGGFPTERGLLLTPGDSIRRDVIGAIMCRDEIDKRAIEAAHGIEFDSYFADELKRLEPLAADELLTLDADALRLTFLGRLFARNVAMIFDAHLDRFRQGGTPQFSRTL